jgi:uncharacterized protein YjiK
VSGALRFALAPLAISLGTLAAPLDGLLSSLDLERPVARYELPRELREVSGLAVLRDGSGRETLLAHDDERAIVHELDPGSGRVLRSLPVGRPATPGDFEGIAVDEQGIVHLTTSDGSLLSFRLSASGPASIPEPARLETGLGRLCEIEGLAAERGGRLLLFLCKEPRGRQTRDRLALLRFALSRPGAASPDPILIPSREAYGKGERARPSDVSPIPGTDRFLLVESREGRLLEITAGGEVLARRRLPASHRQPEGLAVFSDGRVAVADEGRRGVLTIYGPRPPR